MEHLERSCGVPFTRWVDAVVTSDDDGVGASKPEPDVPSRAVQALGLHPLQCAMVGDTIYDAEAAFRAGLAFLGISSGLYSESELTLAGARGVWSGPEELLRNLGGAMALASPGRSTPALPAIESLMRCALGIARNGVDRGEVPSGAVIGKPDGTAIQAAHGRVRERRNLTAHAVTEACAGLVTPPFERREMTVLVTTLEPCAMCLGAAREAGVDAVAYGLPRPEMTAEKRYSLVMALPGPSLRVCGGVMESECRDLWRAWWNRNPDETAHRAFAARVLGLK